MADSIEVLFKMWTQVDPRNHVLDGAHIPPGEGAIFWMGRGAPMMQPFVKIPWPFVLTFCSVCYQSPFQQQTLCLHYAVLYLPSVLWRCWLGGRKGIRLVKNWVVGCWRGYLSGARCRLAYGPADATCHSLSLASVKSRLVLPFWYRLTWVVPDKGPLNVCVCVCYAIHVCVRTKWCCWRVDEGWVRASLWAARCGSGHKTITTISGFSSGRQSCCRLCELWWRQCRERDGYQLTRI